MIKCYYDGMMKTSTLKPSDDMMKDFNSFTFFEN